MGFVVKMCTVAGKKAGLSPVLRKIVKGNTGKPFVRRGFKANDMGCTVRDMNIIVCAKPVYSAKENIVIENGNVIALPENGYVINPFDEFAIEEALRVKDMDANTDILVVSYGDENAESTVRATLALGLDRASFVVKNKEDAATDSLKTAEVLCSSIQNEVFDCILMGKESSDLQNGAVGPMLAGLLDIPIVTNVQRCDFEQKQVTVEKVSVVGVVQKIRVDLPCVITMTKGAYPPRLPSLSGIMKAKNKPFHIVKAAEPTEESREISIKYIPVQCCTECKFIAGDDDQIVSQLMDILKG